ncbi:facilitated trehalose transporter Tret1-like [Cylas formicarius]|uniref:facilitated trehalose transporter Tret1-like n=1 Tax=Cylas formicarius TaxID=197179 RepID=UPI002958C2ED|nr:facilitated trehalose transporter Tret1-like [Cylas formicarius]
MDDSGKAKRLPQFLAAVFICIGAMGTGTVIGWTANINKELEEGALNDITTASLNWIGSIMPIGAVVVCIPIGILADLIGRKFTILLTTIPFVLGWALIIFSASAEMIYAGRFFTGMAGGSFCIMAPLYTSEIAETAIRGTLGTFLQLFITIGILYAQVFGYAVSVKALCYLCGIVPIIFAVLYATQPETPVYLMKKGKREKAMKVFEKLRGKQYDPSAEINEIQAEIDKQEALKSEFWTQLKTKQGKRASLICFMLMFYQQFSGINAVMFYSQKIFIAAKSTIEPKICTIIIGAVQICATLFSSWSIDKLGRKILLMLSDGLMALATFLLAIYFLVSERGLASSETVTSLGWLPLISLIVFIIAFSIGMGPIPWLASSEIFPPAIKAKMGAAAGTFNWFLAFLVTVGYGGVAESAGAYTTFFIFTIVSASGVFFILFVMPETKNKSFEEIQEELGK